MIPVSKEQLLKWKEVFLAHQFSDVEGESYNNDDVIQALDELNKILDNAPQA